MKNTMTLRRTIGATMIGLSAFGLAACGGKPSEGELRDKLAELFEAGGELDADTAGKIADCAAPKMLDQVSDDGLEAIMDADTTDVLEEGGEKVSKEDNQAIIEIGLDCAEPELTGS